jgi:hypothetical protein
MDRVFKSNDATRDASMMQRIVQRLEAEQRMSQLPESETSSEKKGTISQLESV